MFISPFRFRSFSVTAIFSWLLLTSATITTQAQARAYVTKVCENAVAVIDLDTNTVIASIPVGLRPHGVAITPDGARVYVTNTDSATVSIIDTGTNTVVATIPVGVFPIEVAITPDGARAYVANFGSGTYSVIDTQTNTVLSTTFVNDFPNQIAITPDGTRIYVTSGLSGTHRITVFDTATNAILDTIFPPHFNLGLVFTPDGARAYMEQTFEFLSILDTATNTVVLDAPQPNIFHDHMAITADGTRLYVVGQAVPVVNVINTSTNAVVDSIPLAFRPNFIAIGGTRVYTTNVQNTVSVIDTATNTVTATIQVIPNTNVNSGCLSEIAVTTPVPKNKDDCKDGGYKKFPGLGFPNQGQCVKYVNQHAK
jgi:YVTN family beta-propeller protein